MKYDFMEEHGQGFCVRRMCQVLGVSPSGFYAWRNRPKSKRQRANEALVEHVKVAHEETGRRTYGSPRVTYELHAQGIVCGHNRVARLMRKHGIRAKMKRRFKATIRFLGSDREKRWGFRQVLEGRPAFLSNFTDHSWQVKKSTAPQLLSTLIEVPVLIRYLVTLTLRMEMIPPVSPPMRASTKVV